MATCSLIIPFLFQPSHSFRKSQAIFRMDGSSLQHAHANISSHADPIGDTHVKPQFGRAESYVRFLFQHKPSIDGTSALPTLVIRSSTIVRIRYTGLDSTVSAGYMSSHA